MHSKSDNIELMTYDYANEIVIEISSHFFEDNKLI